MPNYKLSKMSCIENITSVFANIPYRINTFECQDELSSRSHNIQAQ
jgi:hypothetical protein